MHQTLMLLTPFVSVSAGIALVLACGDSVPAPDHGSPPARGDQDRRRSDRRKRADEKGRAHEGPRIRRAPKTLMERIKSQAAARLVMGLSHNGCRLPLICIACVPALLARWLDNTCVEPHKKEQGSPTPHNQGLSLL